MISKDVIKSCKKACALEFHTEEPIVLPDPPNDPELGRSPENPATSCIDILKNGGKPNSEVYYVKKTQDEF